MKRAHGFQENRGSQSTTTTSTTSMNSHHHHQNNQNSIQSQHQTVKSNAIHRPLLESHQNSSGNNGIEVVGIQNNHRQHSTNSGTATAAAYATMHPRTNLLGEYAVQHQQQQQQQQQNRPSNRHQDEHDAILGRTTVRLPTVAHLTAVAHHTLQQQQQQHSSTNTSTAKFLKRGILR